MDNDDMSTGMEKKEILNTPDIFWSREPIMGPKGTKENPAIIPSFNVVRCVGLETEQVRTRIIPVQLFARCVLRTVFSLAHPPRSLLSLCRVSSGSALRRARCTSSPTSTSSWSRSTAATTKSVF